MSKTMFYRHEKEIAVQVDQVVRKFILIALSARDREVATIEAQRNHAPIVTLLSEAADSIRGVYLLQESDLLINAILQREQENIKAKAVLTLADDEADNREKIEAKTEAMMEARRTELITVNKEQLADKLVGLEMNHRLHDAWFYNVLEATLVKALHDENRQRIFLSVDEMKDSLITEVLDKLYEALREFLEECGNAQVFLKPHTSNG